MASKSSPLLFEQVSSPESALQFLEDHGFYYEEDAEIGIQVNSLINEGRARSEDARLDKFRQRLKEHPVSRTNL
jgi:hypothetical protein